MRKIKVVSRIYKSLLVLCWKDPFQYIYFVIISITSSVLKTTKIQTIAKKKSSYKNVVKVKIHCVLEIEAVQAWSSIQAPHWSDLPVTSPTAH